MRKMETYPFSVNSVRNLGTFDFSQDRYRILGGTVYLVTRMDIRRDSDD
jgi:hypothetical protein